MRSIPVIARFAILEALRGGLPWLAFACIAGSVGLAALLGQVALTETREFQAAGAAALLRASAAFLIASHIVASIARETIDRGLELALTLPISRPTYYAGKLAGFACCSVMLATAFALPLMPWSAPAALAAWWLSLAVETTLVAAMALFFSLSLNGVVPAIAATASLYLLGRSMSTMQAIAAGPLAEVQQEALAGAVNAFALVIPNLDAGPRTEWLLYGAPPANEYIATLAGSLIYCAVLAFAGLFDFSRRDL